MNNDLITIVNQAKAALIVVAKTARLDSLASALALQLAFVSQGKSATVCFEGNLPEGADKLAGINQISKNLQLGGNILKVSFPYADGAIDKVTYNITDDRFNLLIEPRVGQNPLKSDQVQYSYTGAEVDVIITIDAPALESLGNLYLDNPDIFVREKLINIDRRFDNQQYGNFNLVEKQVSSTSELVTQLLQSLRWDLNPDIATNLYAGLVTSTNNFSSFSTNAQSFEMASYLLKNGARKLPVGPSRAVTKTPSAPFSTAPGSLTSKQSIFEANQTNVQAKPTQEKAEATKQPPQDWLKPKIFKSGDLV